MYKGVTSTEDAAIDLLFGQTPGADTLVGGKKPEKPEPDPATGTGNPGEESPEGGSDEPDPISQLFGETPDPDPQEGEGEEKEKPVKTAAKAADPKPASTAEVDYEQLYLKLVDDGVWKEVELEDNTEWTPELFSKIQELQAETRYEDLLDRTGTFGKTIIEFEKNGGNPSEMLDLFREQRSVQDFDISDKEGQIQFLRAFYESQGSSEKGIDRNIKALSEQGDEALKEEAEEKQAIWNAQYSKAIEERNKEQKLIAKQLEEETRQFHSNIQETLTADPEVTPKERKELGSYILNYGQVHNKRNVSQFYLDMLNIQKDPKQYVELAKFVKGLKTGEYRKKIESKAAKTANAKNFLLIKNGSTLKPTGGQDPAQTPATTSTFLDLLRAKKK